MQTKHTPGPWANDPLQPTIWANDGQTQVATVADLPWKDGKSDWMTEQANARLIAAAPELLAALKHCAGVIHAIRTGNVPPDLIPHIDSERLAESAIAKATGTL